MNAAIALDAPQVASAIREACVTEIRAFKPGNVSLASAGHGMRAEDFLASADAASLAMTVPGLTVGERILRAIEATRTEVPFNTNLGIVLLCAPLAHAAMAAFPGCDLRERLQTTLAALDVADAECAYAAIRLASPGGLGTSQRHDVHETPSVTLLEAMREAADRDRIAYQYVSGYRDVFGIGMPTARAVLERGHPPEWAAVIVYLEFLSRYPDSHVARKYGTEAAERLSVEVRETLRSLDLADPARSLPDLDALDRRFKNRGINPGTSADLTVASLASMALEDSLNRR